MLEHNYNIVSSLNGRVNYTSLVSFTRLNSEPGVIYSLIDVNTNRTPEGLRFYQEQNVLIVEHNGKKMLAFRGFFAHKENPAKFVVDNADGKMKSMVTVNSAIVDENGREHVIPSEPLSVTNPEPITTNSVALVDTAIEPETVAEESNSFAGGWIWFAVGGAIILAGVAAGCSSSSSGKKDSSTDKPKPDEPDAGRPTLESIKATGNTITLTYHEALDGDHLPEASTFAIQVIGGGANNPVTAVAISDSGDAIILTLTNPIAKGSNFTIAYTDPTTGDDTNAIQDEQGNDASTFNGKTGLVIDGYIQGAQLYADYNNNGIAEDDEILEGIITDEFGRFFLTTTDINAPLIAVGGTSIDTGIENTLTMRAPEGATVINPITTVLQQYLSDNEGTSLEQAETAVKEILGIALPTGERLSDYEPISSKNQEMQEIAAQIVEVAMQAETTKAGDGSTVFENIAATKTPLDLTTADDVTAITKGTGITAETVQALVTQTTNIKDTDTIADIATQQKSLIVALTDDTGLEDDDLNSSVGTIEVTRKFTGNIQYSIDDGVIWTDDFDAEEGDNNLQVRQVDAEGKVLSAITTFAFILDSTAPTIVITDTTEDAAIGDVTYSFAFSEAVMGFTADDITVSGGSKGLFVQIGDMTYQLVVTPDVDSTQITVDVAANVATDLAGNENIVADQLVHKVDTIIPTVAITDDTIGTATGAVTYTFTFSEEVKGFTVGDIKIVGGTAIGILETTDNIIYTLLVAPSVGSTQITVDVAAGVATDFTDNENTVAVQSVQQVDTTIPAVAITDDTTGTARGDVTYTFTFSEEVKGFTVGDIKIVGGIATGTLKTTDNIIYTLVVTPNVGSTQITVNVAAGVATDFTDNENTVAVQSVQQVDTTIPTVAITDDTIGTATGAVTYTFTFSEEVEGFTVGDIKIVGGTAIGILETTDNIIYTLLVAPSVGSTQITVDVAAGVATDFTDNENTVAVQSVQQVDTTIPAVAITDDTTGTARGDVTYTFTFSEEVKGFTVGDIKIVGGIATGTLKTTDNIIYTLVVTPDVGSTQITVDVAAGVATNFTDDENTVAVQSVQQVDTTIPTVAITDDTAGTATGAVTYTFTFSEEVKGFTVGDIKIVGGIATGALETTDNIIYTLVVTPNVGSTQITVNVAAGVATDFTDNENTVAVQSVQQVDTTIPTVAITDDTIGTATGAVTYTFTFSEEVKGFTVSDIKIVGGTAIGTLETTDNIIYTLLVAPSVGSTQITVDVAAGVATDFTDNENTVAVQSVQQVDTTIPAVAITDDTTGTARGDVTYTFTFSEEVKGFAVGDIKIVGGTAIGTLETTDNIIYTLLVAPSVGSTQITVDVAAGVATDFTDNENTVAVQSVQQVDTTIPAVAITDDTTGTARGDVTYTFTFSEEVKGFAVGDIKIVGGTAIGTLETTDNIIYTLLVAPSVGSTQITVDVAAGVATDFTDNENTVAVQSVQQVDTTIPTVAITDDTVGTARGAVTYTFTFSEEVKGFTVGDIKIVGGIATGTLETTDNIIYTLVVTPNVGSTQIAVDVAAGVATDFTDNENTVAVQSVQQVDTTIPAVAITDDTTGTARGDVTYTFTFSEEVKGFTVGDIKIVGGDSYWYS